MVYTVRNIKTDAPALNARGATVYLRSHSVAVKLCETLEAICAGKQRYYIQGE